jgi:hypothetical protein
MVCAEIGREVAADIDPVLVVTRLEGDPEALAKAFAERYERSNHGGRTVPEHVYFTVSGKDANGLVLVELWRERRLRQARRSQVPDPSGENNFVRDATVSVWELSLNHCYPDLDRNISAFREGGFTVATP